MESFWLLFLAVMLANFLTIMFGYGLYRASKIFDGDPIDGTTIGAIFVPLVIFLSLLLGSA